MASCQTTRVAGSSGSISSPYAKLVVSEQSSTATQSVLAWTLYYIAPYAASTSGARSYSVTINGSSAKSSTYDINGKTGTNTVASGTVTISKTSSAQTISFGVTFAFNLTWGSTSMGTRSASSSISVAAKTSYTISYNANGGTGAPGSQTKTNGVTLTLTTAKPTRDGYTFGGWATSSDGSAVYQPGGSYTSNDSATLYAVWTSVTYTVSYNANGGSNAPSNQTKEYNASLTITSTKPTRTGYAFSGWGTSPADTTAKYQSGGSYTANVSVTLYAIWTATGNPPTVNNLRIKRTATVNNAEVADDEGTHANVYFTWTSESNISSIKIYKKLITSSSYGSSYYTVPSQSGKSGTVNVTIGGTVSPTEFYTDESYNIKIVLTDNSSRTTEITKTLTNTIYPIDVMHDQSGICFGGPASKSLCEIVYKTQFTGGIELINLNDYFDVYYDLDNVTKPGFYYADTASNYTHRPSVSGSFTLEVYSAGSSGQLMQRFTLCDKTNSTTYERFYYGSAWGDWMLAYGMTKIGTITANSDFTLGRGFITRSGNVVNMFINITTEKDLTKGTGYKIGSISDFSPGASVAAAGIVTVGSGNDATAKNYIPCVVWVNSSGEIYMRISSTQTVYMVIEANLSWDLGATWQ